jgi:hypothetical protein
MKKILSAAILGLAISQPMAFAQEQATDTEQSKVVSFDLSKLYIGAGLNHNRIDSSSMFGGSDGDANGFQLFAGYEYGNRNGFDLATEFGLIQTDNFYSGGDDADGIWAAGVISKGLPEIDSNLAGLLRIGYGINGDDGIFMGFGAQYRIRPQSVVRLEYVNKDLTQSYQLNAVYEF